MPACQRRLSNIIVFTDVYNIFHIFVYVCFYQSILLVQDGELNMRLLLIKNHT